MSASPTRRSASSRPYRQPAARLARTAGSVRGSGTATPEGSITQTIASLPDASDPDGLVLRLRGAHEPSIVAADSRAPSTRRRIQWAEDVVDNEGLGRKKSKVCCIYHKTRDFGESSDEDDSSDSSSEGSDGSDDDGSAKPVGSKRRGRGRKRKDHKHDHGHGHGDGCGHDHTQRKPSPNAYEKMPKYDVKPLKKQPGS